jgi:hypothetical protein
MDTVRRTFDDNLREVNEQKSPYSRIPRLQLSYSSCKPMYYQSAAALRKMESLARLPTGFLPPYALRSTSHCGLELIQGKPVSRDECNPVAISKRAPPRGTIRV